MKKTIKKPTKKTTPKPTPKYKLEIRVNNQILKAEGDDINKMLSSIDFPTFIKSETNIIVLNEKKTIQKDLKVFNARRCFTGYDNTSLELLSIALTKQLG